MTVLDRRLVQEDAVLWQGSPSWWAIARDVYHIRGICAYLAFLVVLDAAQAWAKAIPLVKALHDSVPLAVIVCAVLFNFGGLAYLTARTTRYTIMRRRVILTYGVAIAATLSIPWSRVRRIELAEQAGGCGDVALTLAADDHMPYLKLWPHARPWRMRHPQPMLRGIEQAAEVAGLAMQACQAWTASPGVATISQGKIETRDDLSVPRLAC